MSTDVNTDKISPTVVFHERLGILGYLAGRFRRHAIFYCTQSLLLRVAARLLPAVFSGRARTISYGDLAHVTDIRRNAYRTAREKLGELNVAHWHLRPLRQLAERNDLIIEKYLIQRLFEKYEFYGLVNQYATEHPDHAVTLMADPLFFDARFLTQPRIRMAFQRIFHRLEYVAALSGVVAYSAYFLLRHRGENSRVYEQAVVCEVDCPVIVAMFRDLLDGYDHLHLVAKRSYFSSEEASRYGVDLHGLSAADRRLIGQLGVRMVGFALGRGLQFAHCGGFLFDLCQMYAHGIHCTPDATDCAYLTFEHLSIEKAVRNELLRARGTRSVFVPYNVYTTSPFYAPEYRLNYDILCSPGELCERSYALLEAETGTVLATGPYHVHKRAMARGNPAERIAALSAFKGDAVAITVLCNGIEDVTRSGEARLMALARRLADMAGIQIFIRQKPVQPPAPYARFYEETVGGHPSILLTHAEYELYDFLEVTDLFLTTNSSSVLDFCAVEAPFFAVDFWKRTDMFSWQTAVPGIYLSEEEAEETICGWVRNDPPGHRMAHQARVAELSRLLAHRFDNFDSYKKNFRQCLNPYLPRQALPLPTDPSHSISTEPSHSI